MHKFRQLIQRARHVRVNKVAIERLHHVGSQVNQWAICRNKLHPNVWQTEMLQREQWPRLTINEGKECRSGGQCWATGMMQQCHDIAQQRGRHVFPLQVELQQPNVTTGELWHQFSCNEISSGGCGCRCSVNGPPLCWVVGIAALVGNAASFWRSVARIWGGSSRTGKTLLLLLATNSNVCGLTTCRLGSKHATAEGTRVGRWLFHCRHVWARNVSKGSRQRLSGGSWLTSIDFNRTSERWKSMVQMNLHRRGAVRLCHAFVPCVMRTWLAAPRMLLVVTLAMDFGCNFTLVFPCCNRWSCACLATCQSRLWRMGALPSHTTITSQSG